MNFARVRAEWFGNIRGDVLSGLVVALALIPEAIAFSIIAGVDPKVGLYASFSIAVIIAFVGGRPRMIFSSGYFGDIKLWPEDGSSKPLVLEHGGTVQSLAVLPDGRLVSGGAFGEIELWPKDGSPQPLVLQHGSSVLSLAVLPDGRLASGGKLLGGLGGEIKLWVVEEEKLIAALCLRVDRNLTKDEWARYIGSGTPWQPSCRNRPSNWRTPDP